MGKIHGRWSRLWDWILERPHVYAHMDFRNPEDFRAACRAVRDRHQG